MVPAYLEVGSDGGVFAFGGAPYFGSMGGRPLSRPIVGIAATPDGQGYWEVASDGGVFLFGDAGFFGSMGGRPLSRPIVGIAATPDGQGYWEVASDGGVFSFGDAGFFGSMGGSPLDAPVVAISGTPGGGGYWEVASDGGVFTFGNAGYFGSMGGVPLQGTVVGMAGSFGTGQITLTEQSGFPPGSYGYDVSVFQDNGTCSAPMPQPHTIGIVEVTGFANGSPNPCLAHEAAWAGAGLNLYTFLTSGTSAVPELGCGGNQWCNWGAAAFRYAANYAISQGADIRVTWWLDVEGGGLYWSSNTTNNDAVIAGAIGAAHAMGLTVGIYSSPLTWSGIAGKYQPDVPLWVAWYTGNPQGNCATAMSFAAAHGDALPDGGVWLTQYTDNNGSLDGDYAC